MEHPELFLEHGSSFMQPNVQKWWWWWIRILERIVIFCSLLFVWNIFKGFLSAMPRWCGGQSSYRRFYWSRPTANPTSGLTVCCVCVCAPPRILSLPLHLGFDPSVRLWVLTSPLPNPPLCDDTIDSRRQHTRLPREPLLIVWINEEKGLCLFVRRKRKYFFKTLP